jgi:hypothetical protein
MLLCPVDLTACTRAACDAGHCALTGEPRMQVCVECGAVETHAGRVGLCVVCWHAALDPTSPAMAPEH